ncbi:MAG: WYL domain-containing protein [Sphingobacteriales bacterium]|nr:WYL domain-containing protein [Sphingobacteriales bacterium]
MSSKSTRLLFLYKELRKGPLDIIKLKSISKQKDWIVSDRTLYRYMDELERDFQVEGENIVINTMENNKKQWKITFDGDEKEHITENDIITFFLLKNYIPQSIRQNREHFFDKFYEWCWKRLSKSKTYFYINNQPNCFINTDFAETVYTQKEQSFLRLLIEAIQELKTLKIKYQFDYTSLHKSTSEYLTIIPLKIILHRGTLHICYLNINDEQINLLALDQIIELKHEDYYLKKQIPQNFENLLENLFGITNNIDEHIYDIELEISSTLGEFIKRRSWHPTQIFNLLENGNYLMTMRCGINRN